MSGKRVFLGGLLVALLGLAEVRGQGGTMGYGPGTLPPPAAGAPGDPAAVPAAAGPVAAGPEGPGLSSWIVYCRGGGCCGPVGGNGHIDSEVYFRTGVTLTVNTGGLSDVIHTAGWDVEGGGGRVLFFNAPEDAAWTVDLGLVNINQNATGGPARTFPLRLQGPNPLAGTPGQPNTIPVVGNVSVSGLNRTYVSAGLGHEWYVVGNRNTTDGPTWRWGADVGGLYGTGMVEFNEIQHREEMIGGFFLAVHSDVEVPCGCCIWQFGIRGEIAQTYTALLQPQNNADILDINLLLTLGFRF